jgi:hypothetical protein
MLSKMNDLPNYWERVKGGAEATTEYRVAPDHKLDFFVGYSINGYRQFTFKCELGTIDADKIPELENIRLILGNINDAESLTLELQEKSFSDVFAVICYDLVEASDIALTTRGAAQIFLSRLGRWSELLKRSTSKGLSFSEQLGLMGELYMLKSLMNEGFEPGPLIRGWRGPEGDVKDIGLNAIRIEIKAQMATQKPVLKISSLEQLELDNRKLFLVLFRFGSAERGISLKSLIDEITENYLASNNKDLIEFLRKLYLIGYEAGATYLDEQYQLSSTHTYEIISSFPTLTATKVDKGIIKAQYQIDCEDLDEFECPFETLLVAAK